MNDRPIFQPSFGNRPEQLIGRDEVLVGLINDLQTYPGSYERRMSSRSCQKAQLTRGAALNYTIYCVVEKDLRKKYEINSIYCV